MDSINKHNVLPKEIVQESRKWVLLGAGPSLDDHWAKILELSDAGYKIAVSDMAFLPSIYHGVKIDVVFTCESKAYPFFNRPYLKTVMRQSLPEFSVVAWAGVNPYQLEQLDRINDQYKASFFLWEQDYTDKESLQESAAGDMNLPVLPGAGNVTNAMVVFLSGIKNSELVLFGNDYSFTYKNYYVNGAPHNGEAGLKRSRFQTNETRYYDILKRSIKARNGYYTVPQFIEYSKWQKKYIDLIQSYSKVYTYPDNDFKI